MTLYEVAVEMGISYQRVWSIEREALKKVRTYLFNRFGDDVTIEDIFPHLGKESIYEQMSIM